MSDRLTREFRTQLTTTMDSVLRRAMLEIMQIFENSLHDHQMELVQRGEEIAQLKIKLQRTEIKLRDAVENGVDSGAEGNVTQLNDMQREPEDVLNAAEQTCDQPEIDFEVPDDWCAPLGCETVPKQEDGVCPSVRLRSLYIPLWHCPVMKREDMVSHQQKRRGRKPKRGSSLKERHKHTQNRKSSLRGQGRTLLRNDMKLLLRDSEYLTDLIGRPAGLRRGQRNLTGKNQKHTLKSKKEEGKIAAAESKSTEQETVENVGGKTYTCKFCKKVFDTPFGRSVHVRSHKKCRGCKKEFPFPSSLRSHKQFCAKLKRLLLKEEQSTDPPKPQSCDEEKPAAPSKTQVIIKKENTPSSGNHTEEKSIQKNGSSVQKNGSSIKKNGSSIKKNGSSIKKNGSSIKKNGSSIKKNGPTREKKYTCVQCNRKCRSRCGLKEHMRVHTGEKPYPCSMCPKNFRIKQSLTNHIMRMHKNQVNPSERNGDLAWTNPLELTEENREDLISPSKDTSRVINHDKVQREHDPNGKPREKWQTMGRRSPDGYICLVCKRPMKNKYSLIEHFRTHTGEKPLKCGHCPAKFRTSGQLSLHRRKCVNFVFQCEKCEKRFPSQMKLDKHVSNYHRDWELSCKVCGKGFITEGRLRNHMKRHE